MDKFAPMFLTLIETSSNQSFIFSTNKLRENIGASELTYRAGTQWVLTAISNVADEMENLWDKNVEKLRDNLLNQRLNPPIESLDSKGIEVIVAASGKAIFLSHIYEDAKSIIERVTRTALHEAPGLNICGYIHEYDKGFDWKNACLGKLVEDAHKQFDEYKNQRRTPNQRFQRLPVVQACSVSGHPASTLSHAYSGKGEKPKPISKTSLAKLKTASEEQSKHRLRSLLQDEPNTEFASTTSELDQLCDWLAIVHADGNGLGKIFQKFHEHINATAPEDNRTYICKLRRFSIALDQCTQSAFVQALHVLPRRSPPDPESSDSQVIPLAPLVLGGDDLTVVCDGRYALQFTHAFLTAFEAETASAKYCDGIIPEVAKEELKADRRLSACAGISIVKPHFPFSVAYDLAESLIQSAKMVKKRITSDSSKIPYPCSAIDFNILYDSSVIDLDNIRDRLSIEDDHTQLHNRPYVVTDLNQLQPVSNDAKEWVKFHSWSTLCHQVQILKATDDKTGDRLLPTSQMHDLRNGLFQGKLASDAQVGLIQKRYSKNGFDELLGSSNSLFKQLSSGQTHITQFLDALDSLEFFENAQEPTP